MLILKQEVGSGSRSRVVSWDSSLQEVIQRTNTKYNFDLHKIHSYSFKTVLRKHYFEWTSNR
jgi:hypothetical protein